MNELELILFFVCWIGGFYVYKKDWYNQKGFYHYFRVIINIIFCGSLVLGLSYLTIYGLIRYIIKHYL